MDERWAVERGLQLAAQNAIDVATHIAASSGRPAADYTDAFDVLAEMGALPADFALRFRAVAGFRNVLVRGYLNVDRAVIHQATNAGLDDFTSFVGHIRAWLA